MCAPIDDDLVLSEGYFQYINTKRKRSWSFQIVVVKCYYLVGCTRMASSLGLMYKYTICYRSRRNNNQEIVGYSSTGGKDYWNGSSFIDINFIFTGRSRRTILFSAQQFKSNVDYALHENTGMHVTAKVGLSGLSTLPYNNKSSRYHSHQESLSSYSAACNQRRNGCSL